MPQPPFRNPFEPLRIPAGMKLEHVGCYKSKSGRILGIYRMPVLDTLLWEDPMDQLFKAEIVSVEPMKAPVGEVFFLDYPWKSPTE